MWIVEVGWAGGCVLGQVFMRFCAETLPKCTFFVFLLAESTMLQVLLWAPVF